jgi:hypothetical protein
MYQLSTFNVCLISNRIFSNGENIGKLKKDGELENLEFNNIANSNS